MKNNINNNKGLTTRIKDKSGKIITTDTKYAVNLMDLISKNKDKNDEAKTVFNDNSIRSISSINSEKPSDNRKKLLRFERSFYRICLPNKNL